MLKEFLSIDTVLFSVMGYQMSYLEFFGTLFNLWSVWLVAKNKILTWPIGIVGVILFGFLFYQIQLYSDLLEQVYYLLTGFYGWWLWWRLKRVKGAGKTDLAITHNSSKANLVYLSAIASGGLLLTLVISRIHLWLPTVFLIPASYPFLDAITTVMSFSAQLLMAKKKIECWYLWIAVDVIGVLLYFTKGVVFISLLYLIFLVLATKGLFNWRKILATSQVKEK